MKDVALALIALASKLVDMKHGPERFCLLIACVALLALTLAATGYEPLNFSKGLTQSAHATTKESSP